jgi:hypothetical protein
MMWTLEFWKGAGERALKTFIQTFLASLVAAVGAGTSAWDVSWAEGVSGAAGIALLATFFSMATSIGNANFTSGNPGTVVVTGKVTGE